MADAPGSIVTIGGIEARVKADGYRKGRGPNSTYRKIVYLVDWDDSDEFIDLLIGGSATSTGGVITFQQPHQYPGNTNLVCVEAHGSPKGVVRPVEPKLFAADGCWVEATYEIPVVDPYGNSYAPMLDGDIVPYTSLRASNAKEMISIDAENLLYETSGLSAEGLGRVQKPIPLIRYEYRRGNIPGTLFADFELMLDSLCETLNEYPIFNADVGCFYFDGWGFSHRLDAGGNIVTEFAIDLLRKQWDHNLFVVDGTLRDQDYLVDEDDHRLLPYADWSILKSFGL